MMTDRWGDQFDFERWQQSVDEKIAQLSEELGTILLELENLRQERIAINPDAINPWVPKNWRDR